MLVFLVCWVYNDKDILASCCVLWLCLVCFVVVFGVLWLYLRYSRISCFVCLCFWCVGCIMIRISWHHAVFCGCVWCVLWLCLVCYGCICGIVGYPVLCVCVFGVLGV